MADSSDLVVRAARLWIGTPYRHRASSLGHGADCLGVIRGVWRETVGPEPVDLPLYTPNWRERSKFDAILDAFGQVFTPVQSRELQVGDVIVFRFKAGAICKHAGILTRLGTTPAFIHAYSRRGVVENSFDLPWQRRVAAVFRFPVRSD